LKGEGRKANSARPAPTPSKLRGKKKGVKKLCKTPSGRGGTPLRPCAPYNFPRIVRGGGKERTSNGDVKQKGKSSEGDVAKTKGEKFHHEKRQGPKG